MNNKSKVVLEIEGNSVECDKALLISNSDYFSAMFTGNFKESSQNNIKIEGVDLRSFNIILLLLWDETYIIDMKDIHLVLQAACMLQFNSIRTVCEKRILDMLSSSISLRIWRMTEMLDIAPLCLKAKFLALEEFPQIYQTESILELSLEEICTYLGHVNLNAKTEMSVFQAAMNWYYEKSNQYQDISSTKLLLKLLSCLNVRQLSQSDINEIKTYPDIKENPDILSVLDIIVNLNAKHKIVCDISQESLSFAAHLYNSKNRKVPVLPCLLLEGACSKEEITKKDTKFTQCKRGEKAVVVFDNYGRKRRLLKVSPSEAACVHHSDMSVLLYDSVAGKFKEFFIIGEDKVNDLAGFKLLSYKQSVLLYGGEYLIGAGQWNVNLWSYDTFKEIWNRINVLPHTRRHFETIIHHDSLYIMGGIGRFRVAQDNLLWYDFNAGVWSALASLPSQSRQFKCCTFRDGLYLVYVVEGKVYSFNEQQQTWSKINIAVNKDILDNLGTYTVFTDSNYFYIKGKTLLQLKLIDFEFVLVSQNNICKVEYEEIDSIQCNSLVYTLYKCLDEHYSQVYIFEELNLETFQTREIFRKVVGTGDSLDVDGKSFCLTASTKLFSSCYYAMEDEFVNDFL